MRENITYAYKEFSVLYLMQKYYFDTCIWIDYLNERDKYVVDIVFKIISNHQVLVSRVVLKELERFVPNVGVINLHNVLFVETFDAQEILAINISKERNIPSADVLHAIIARDNGAILITRDKHFLKLKDIGCIKLF